MYSSSESTRFPSFPICSMSISLKSYAVNKNNGGRLFLKIKVKLVLILDADKQGRGEITGDEWRVTGDASNITRHFSAPPAVKILTNHKDH